MEALQLACKVTPLKNFDQIQTGEYRVRRFSFAETRYGKKIKVETDFFACFLPDRFTKFIASDKDIADINTVPHMMIYRGKDVTQKNRIILDFKPLNESQWMLGEFLTVPMEQNTTINQA